MVKAVIVVCAVVCLTLSSYATEEEPEVTFSDGTIRGRIAESNQGIPVQQYLGIQFGKAPVGDLRYADPQPVDPWTGVRDAGDYGYSCYQLLDLTFGPVFKGSTMWNTPNEQSEDCLYLNVWTPHPRPENAVVMVWIFGGGFYSGTSALAVYDGKTLSGYSSAIVVSMNYRVGSLGFLATGDGRIKGNFGLKDQQLALKWIQKNIAQFGGDPNSVTIMGESAGAASVGFHMMSPGSADLFHRGIMQSGSPEAHWAYMSRDVARRRSKKLFNTFECPDDDDVLTCLRKPTLTPTFIINNEWVEYEFLVFPWAPTLDGEFLHDSPNNLNRQGKVKDVNLLLGVNKDEGTFWILYAVPTYNKDNTSTQSWGEALNAIDITEYDLEDSVKETMLRLYTMGDEHLNDAHNRDVVDDIVGDRSFICPTVEFADSNIKRRKRTYFYRLEQRANNEVWPDWMGVIHGADCQYVFGIALDDSLGYSEDDATLSKEIMTYWSNFARSGSPNGPNQFEALRRWPAYGKTEKYIDFCPGAETKVGTQIRSPYCDFWSIVQTLKWGVL